VKPILLLALVLATACTDDDADSYAYITKAHAYTKHSGTRRDDYCDMIAKLPRALVASQPADADTSLLGSNATTVTQEIGDSNNDCEDHLHTWMHVTFAHGDRTNVAFDPPDPGITWQRVVGLGLAVFLIPGYVRDKLRARRQRRRR
jgi:hypothetical protein